MYPVKVLEACVKNCGAPMHKEVATKDMMDSFRELAKVDTVCSFLLYDFATTGLEIATNTVTFVTKFFPLRPKYTSMEKSQICNLLSPLLFRNKRVSSCYFADTFAKINK